MRRKNDFYETPSRAVDILIDQLGISSTRILEPCAGDLAIAAALRTRKFVVATNDLHRDNCDNKLDARLPGLYLHYGNEGYNWVITNPPFNSALDILVAAYKEWMNVALLLRLSFLEPTLERQLFLRDHPPTHLIVLPRISFTNDGKTDSVTCAWMVWEQKKSNQSIKIITKGQMHGQ